MSLRDFLSPEERRKFLETEKKIDLSSLKSDLEKNSSVHCENLIGAVSVPLGIAGPLTVNKTKIYIPLATTEGALVASVSRGAKAISQSGGAKVKTFYHGQTRGPVFLTHEIEKGLLMKSWIESNNPAIKKAASDTSKHIVYLGAKVKTIGQYTFVRFSFDTKNAMGMNMVTIATEAIARLIETKTKIPCIAVAGNFDIDKKPSWLNVIEGRGYEVWAEAVISKKILNEVLHAHASDIYKTWVAKCMVGSFASGSLGFNAHFANITAGIFIATGQDPAHVSESSMGITTCEERKDDLFVSINIPSLQIGTVGGGTVLPSQKNSFEIMGITPKTSPSFFAECIGGAVLAGELSLLASLTTRTLGSAHEELGRKKK